MEILLFSLQKIVMKNSPTLFQRENSHINTTIKNGLDALNLIVKLEMQKNN